MRRWKKNKKKKKKKKSGDHDKIKKIISYMNFLARLKIAQEERKRNLDK